MANVGFIADTAEVDTGSHVGTGARVEGRAVLKNSDIWDRTVVGGAARVTHSSLHGSARVEGGGVVLHDCALNDDVQVGGNAILSHCTMGGAAHVYGDVTLVNIHVHDDSCVFGNAQLGDGRIQVQLSGGCKFGGHATFKGMSDAHSFVVKYGKEKVEVVNRSSVILTDVWDMG